MTNENFRVLYMDGEYALQGTDVAEEKRTVYWVTKMNPNNKFGNGKIIDIEAKTDDEAKARAKTVIEDLHRSQ